MSKITPPKLVKKSPPKGFEGDQSQFDKFLDASRELECDESEARFNSALKKVAATAPKPVAKPDKPQKRG